MPLEDRTIIDMVLTPDAHGKIGLIITDSGVTTDPEERLNLLQNKLQVYVADILQGGLAAEYPGKTAGDFFIHVTCALPPTAAMLAITSVGEPPVPVTFETWNPAAQTVPETADAYAWVQRIKYALDEPTTDQIFIASASNVLEAALKAAAQSDFVFGQAFKADGSTGDSNLIHEAEAAGQEVDPEKLAEARSTAATMPARFAYWFIAYVTLREADDSDSGKPQPWVVVEGWKRGVQRGAAIGHAFQRANETQPFALVNVSQFIGIVPVNAFGATVSQFSDTPTENNPEPVAPVMETILPELKNEPAVTADISPALEKVAPHSPISWRWLILLLLPWLAFAGYSGFQKYRELHPPDPAGNPVVSNKTAPGTNSPPATTAAPDDNAAPHVSVASDVTILSASYGTASHTEDVTDRVRELVSDHPEGFATGAKAMKIDPVPGKKKQLKIQYNYGGSEYDITITGGKKMSYLTLINHAQQAGN